jgi:hypothetical protein
VPPVNRIESRREKSFDAQILIRRSDFDPIGSFACAANANLDGTELVISNLIPLQT